MLKFTLRSCYITLMCCLLSACYQSSVSSFIVKSDSNQQLIQNTDTIAIIPEFSFLQFTGTNNEEQSIFKTHFKQLGYNIVDYNPNIKPSIIVIYNLDQYKGSHTAKVEVCHYKNIPDPADPNNLSNPNNDVRECQYEDTDVVDYTYFGELYIYKANTLCDDKSAGQCTTILRKQTDKPLFSSKIQFTKDKPLNTITLYPMMARAVLTTFPLTQTSRVSFETTPDGYIPTQIEIVDPTKTE